MEESSRVGYVQTSSLPFLFLSPSVSTPLSFSVSPSPSLLLSLSLSPPPLLSLYSLSLPLCLSFSDSPSPSLLLCLSLPFPSFPLPLLFSRECSSTGGGSSGTTERRGPWRRKRVPFRSGVVDTDGNLVFGIGYSEEVQGGYGGTDKWGGATRRREGSGPSKVLADPRQCILINPKSRSSPTPE